MDQWEECTHPLPRSGSCNADGLRAPQLEHAVEGVDGNVHLGRPTLVRAGAQPVTDHLLEPADSGFDAGTGGVAGRLLPGRSSVLGDALQVAVPLCRRRLGRLAWHGRGTRRHNDRRFRMTLSDRGGNAFLVVAPSAVNEATGAATWSSKGPTWEPSSTSLVVSAVATIWPVSASIPMCSFRQDRRVLVPCFSSSHSPAPQSFRPVLSTSRWTASPSLRGRGRGTSSVSARRHRVV